MDLCYCEKCHKWFDVNGGYDEILIAKKTGGVYEGLHFCKECGKKMHEAINGLLNEKASEKEVDGNG